MACQKLHDLKLSERSARDRFAQYAYEQNKHLWGVSKTQAARIAKEEQARTVELTNEIDAHRAHCDVCLADGKAN
jgi:hypothetical protein